MARKLGLIFKALISTVIVAITAWFSTVEGSSFLGLSQSAALSWTWVLFAAAFAACLAAQSDGGETSAGRILAWVSVSLLIATAAMHLIWVFRPMLMKGEGGLVELLLLVVFEAVAAVAIVRKWRTSKPYLCCLGLAALPLAASAVYSTAAALIALALLPLIAKVLWVAVDQQVR